MADVDKDVVRQKLNMGTLPRQACERGPDLEAGFYTTVLEVTVGWSKEKVNCVC